MRYIITFFLCVSLCSCSSHSDANVMAHAELIELSVSSVKLVVSSTDEPVCISSADLSPHYGRISVFGKNGEELFRSNSVNRELQAYKGMDVADGVLIVLKNRSKTILIPLSEFDNGGKGPIRGYVEFSYSPCYSLFGNGNASVKSMQVRF